MLSSAAARRLRASTTFLRRRQRSRSSSACASSANWPTSVLDECALVVHNRMYFYWFEFFNGKFSASARWAASGEPATFKIEFLPPNGLGTVSLASGSGIHWPSTTRHILRRCRAPGRFPLPPVADTGGMERFGLGLPMIEGSRDANSGRGGMREFKTDRHRDAARVRGLCYDYDCVSWCLIKMTGFWFRKNLCASHHYNVRERRFAPWGVTLP